ncbi:nitric oxide synthase isoform X2 [Episyrphus balteatus]|uniref:nitric oxide synthase isoform X2 n=1 Tax=Episyrphus balteatus TaxID=286459 RepID=UPI002485A22B|nr:nitric oxide synthase isoform X2 [Episyrphus balteatus]
MQANLFSEIQKTHIKSRNTKRKKVSFSLNRSIGGPKDSIEATNIEKYLSIDKTNTLKKTYKNKILEADSKVIINKHNIMEEITLGSREKRGSFGRKHIRLRNMLNYADVYDTLNDSGKDILACSNTTCVSSIVFGNTASNKLRSCEVILEHAMEFLNHYFTSINRCMTNAHTSRWEQVQKMVRKNGHYHLTETELIYGAKLAWRNSSRCIGRIQWSKLQVFDCRYVTTTSGMFEAICNHIKYATNKGNIRSAITIFPQKTDENHDFRIWNNQLISYAGYKQNDGSVIGDPMNVEITESHGLVFISNFLIKICLKLGWKAKQTEWDILPLIVSANGLDPDYFEYPPELVLQVPLEHPNFKWFAELNLRWYSLPAVSSMLFDCGGVQFTATAFSGWYMSTEIGCRNLCDTNRRNILEKVALKMGLDTRTSSSLWKDKALVEVNIAVLHSFQSRNITIVDHHTASESFMKHFDNELKIRNGCPSDWIWIVPPLSGSITPVFHQEMALYHLRPSFEYQDAAWKTHVWKKENYQGKSKKPRKKFNFKQIARAVKFTSKLFGRALSKRIKATILYATETGKSEQYSKKLCEILGHAFNAQTCCMSDYDISFMEHEALLIVIASTFGNGDPPENGEEFAQELYKLHLKESCLKEGAEQCIQVNSSKSFIKANSRNDFTKLQQNQLKKIRGWRSLRDSTTEKFTEDIIGPLSNVRFAVFGLGSSAYPNFCAFGQYMDNILSELGGERILNLAYGDEICGQEQSFRNWAPKIYKVACDIFCLDADEGISDTYLLSQNDSLTINTVRLVPIQFEEKLENLLRKYHNKNVIKCSLKTTPINLTNSNENDKTTILLKISSPNVEYEPGDHLGIFPINNIDLVDGILQRLSGLEDPDQIVQLQILVEKQTPNGCFKCWEPHSKMPIDTIRSFLLRFFDITTPPSRQLLIFLSNYCGEKEDEEEILKLINDTSAFEDWKHWKLPHLLEVMQEFPSCRPPAALFLLNLQPLQPRFYSISSSQKKYNNEIHITVTVVKYQSENGAGPERLGVCSNYLQKMKENDEIFIFVRSSPAFHLPAEIESPLILIGPGTGIAPFRSFWQHLEVLKENSPAMKLPDTWLFYGCRSLKYDLYADEKAKLIQNKVLSKVFLALSRETNKKKTYVQDLIKQEFEMLYVLITQQKAHIYVCGDVTMAEDVYQTIRKCVASIEQNTENEAEKIMLSLKDDDRYHEDIFGITLRTAEIHTKSRATAKIRMKSQPKI